MKIAIVGSRNLRVPDLENYLPAGVTEIVSGGARGIDSCTKEYANTNRLVLTEFLPNYNAFGRAAPLHRNLQIIDYADEVIAFWDGSSHGTKFVIDNCKKSGKKITVYFRKPFSLSKNVVFDKLQTAKKVPNAKRQ